MGRFKKITEVTLAAALFAGLAGAVYAQATNDEIIAKRRAEMVTVGRANGGIGAAVRTATPDAATLEALKGEAGKIVAAFDVLKDPALWPKGSGLPEVTAGTKAKAEIWSDPAGFKAALDNSVTAAAALKAATDAGNAEQIKAAQAAMQGTCGGCHSKFRT